MSTYPFGLSENKLTIGDNDHLLGKLIQAINHATYIEITVSFIQTSGLDLLFDPLQEALERGASLKLLTSDYLDITNPVALRQLLSLGKTVNSSAEISTLKNVDLRIYQSNNESSSNSRKQSFHMKSYIFIKTKDNEVVEGCAFIGSNNISKAALTTAHEWSFRHDFEPPRNSKSAQQLQIIRDEFNTIFNHDNVKTLTNNWIDDYIKRRKKMQFLAVESIDLFEETPPPNSTQIEALSALHTTRLDGFKRGLIVLATGMGKTWLSAFDVQQLNAKRVLFVAHREEILIQAQKTYSILMPEKSSGFFNAKNKEIEHDLLFASVQTIGRETHLNKFSPQHFDYIVVDEFHHASAKTYRNLLQYFQPQFLLGLTATPNRTDQADILGLCDNNLVFERDLIQGINDDILVPFHYYGIWDKHVKYQDIPWRNGKFEPSAIENSFATNKRANHILTSWKTHKQSRTLAFCVSTKHADFMADFFNAKGFNACAVHSKSTMRRNEALEQLNNAQLDIIFSVDLFNEGTDLPSIDSILMIRPTESKIIFLQQLGRGLRQNTVEGKEHLVVLDFIGNHKSFLQKPQTFFGGNNIRNIVTKVQAKPELAKGCFINYDIEVLDFWQALAKVSPISIKEEFLEQTKMMERRPTANEFYQNGFDMSRLNTQPNSWFEIVASNSENPHEKQTIEQHKTFLLDGIQKTNMTKCFKAILLEAFLALDGFNMPPTTKLLVEKSWQVLNRYPMLKQQDLPKAQQALTAESGKWHTYWKSNPIKAFTKPDQKGVSWFSVEDEIFKANFDVEANNTATLHDLVQELVDLRLSQYSDRINNKRANTDRKNTKINAASVTDLVQPETLIELPFYNNLPIACGHFKTGEHQDIEIREIDISDGNYGNINPQRHFLALASGNSMNGGKSPILDGDCLLLEWITPNNAGSNNGLIVALETQDETGVDQYLLRKVNKQSNGQYLLVANNPNYDNIIADERIKPFARLKGVVKFS